jgi:pimeloyl-ACP methyl ester carboxylesterase
MIETRDIELPHGIRLSCRTVADALPPGAPRVLLLHGFPEAAFVWDEVMQRLSAQARCQAPNLRGYERSTAPAEVEAYRPKHLVDDISALIENFGAPIDLLVAHDWGGAVAWNLAAQRPHLLKRLLIINSPHPATFLRELRDNPAQQQASSYMTFLCRPDAEALLAANDHERLWKMLTRSSATAPAWASETLRQRYREVWSMGLSGALNFYRASPLRPPVSPDDPLMSLQLPDEAVTVRVPTTVLWGEGDVALLPGLLDGLERWVPDLRVLRVPDATHWIVHERPDWVGAQISHALGLAPDAQTTT